MNALLKRLNTLKNKNRIQWNLPIRYILVHLRPESFVFIDASRETL